MTSTEQPHRSTSTPRFQHQALFYRSLAEFVSATTGFITDGLSAGEPVLVVVNAAKIEALRTELGGDAARVQFADMAAVGQNPARIIPAWQRFTDRHLRADQPVRGIGEPIWATRSADELVECQGHETLLNLAFDQGPAWTLLCPYDVVGLPADVVAEAQRSHPHLLDGDQHSSSPDYVHDHPAPARWDQPLPPAPTDCDRYAIDRQGQNLEFIRHVAHSHALAAGLTVDQAEALTIAVSEMATNAVRHGAGTATMRVWTREQSLICEIADEGRLQATPLLGRQLPHPQQGGGRGFWLAHHLCDLVQLRTGAGGTTVRLHVYRR
ncbi:MAG: sensor histidine kinase [Hamadaea sp.]|nr:sensor histidine kinase [Hamadaea sp.]